MDDSRRETFGATNGAEVRFFDAVVGRLPSLITGTVWDDRETTAPLRTCISSRTTVAPADRPAAAEEGPAATTAGTSKVADRPNAAAPAINNRRSRARNGFRTPLLAAPLTGMLVDSFLSVSADDIDRVVSEAMALVSEARRRTHRCSLAT